MLIFILKNCFIFFNLLRISVLNIMIYILIHSPKNFFPYCVCAWVPFWERCSR